MKQVLATLSITSMLCTAAVCHAGVIRISTFSGAGDAVTRNVASSDEVGYNGYAVVGSEIVLVGFGGGTTVGGEGAWDRAYVQRIGDNSSSISVLQTLPGAGFRTTQGPSRSVRTSGGAVVIPIVEGNQATALSFDTLSGSFGRRQMGTATATRFQSLAIGSDKIAMSTGSADSVPGQARIFIQSIGGSPSPSYDATSQFQTPMAFDSAGRLHAAGVVETASGTRSLGAYVQGLDGTWSVSNLLTDPNLSGHLSLVLDGDERPVLAGWSGTGSTYGFTVWRQTDGEWSMTRIADAPFAAGSQIDVQVGIDGLLHFAGLSADGNSVGYLSTDADLSVLQRRVITNSGSSGGQYLGFDLDQSGNVRTLFLDWSENLQVIPLPSGVLLGSLGLLAVGGIRRRRVAS
jgi:hypothetical protein